MYRAENPTETTSTNVFGSVRMDPAQYVVKRCQEMRNALPRRADPSFQKAGLRSDCSSCRIGAGASFGFPVVVEFANFENRTYIYTSGATPPR